MEVWIVVFYSFMVIPRESGVNLFTITSLTTKLNVYYQHLYKRVFIF